MTRNQIYLILLLCSLLPRTSVCQAQNDTLPTTRQLDVGVGGGILLHDVEFSPPQATETYQGMSYGLRLRYFDHSLVGFQAELSYVQAGWRADLGDDFSELYLRETDYVEVLLLTQFSIGRRAFQPMLQAGPYLAAPLNERERLPDGYVPPATDIPPVFGQPFDFRLNYGLQAGLGFNYTLGRISVQADGRVLVGFNDLVRSGVTTAATSRRSGVGGRVAIFYRVF